MAGQEQEQVSVEKETPFWDPLTSNSGQAPSLETPSPEVSSPRDPSPEAIIRKEGRGEEQAQKPTLSLSKEQVDMGGVRTVVNGLQLRVMERKLPFASFTYAWLPTVEKPSPVDWKILVTEDVQSQHIRCHKLCPGDNLPQLEAQYQGAHAMATVVINTEDSHTLNPSYLQGVRLGSHPVLVLTQQDGCRLLKLLEQYREEDVEGRVDVESMVDPPTQPPITSPPMPSQPVKEQASGPLQKFRQLFGKEKNPSVDLKEIQNLLFPQGEPPFIVSENAGRFGHCMSYFQQYEKTAKSEGNHADVKDILKVMQKRFQDVIVRDFPFYLLLAYRIHLKSSLYMCGEHGNFILGCINEMEAMKPHVIASTFNSFLQRRDFSIMYGDENMSVFQLLQMACLELAKIAARRGPTAQPKIYPRFVFCRMMWVSLALKLCSERRIITRSTSNMWKEYLTRYHCRIVLSDDVIAELKEGLELGQLMHLPPELCFGPQQMGDLLASEDFVRPFWHIRQFVEVIECYIPLEKGFFDLLTTLRADYDPWLRQMRSRNFSSVSIAGTLSGTLWEGLEFLNSLAEVRGRRGFNGEYFDAECIRWLLLLLQLVDITGQTPELHLRQFLKGKGVVKRYRRNITDYVIKEAHKNFAKLTIQQFFPLYKEFRIWSNKFLEEFLSGYRVPPNIKISDPTWREFFSEVVSRFTGAYSHYYLLDFLKSVAACYRSNGRAEELVLDLLHLKVPKLFASVGEGREDSAVQQDLTAFLKDYINRNALKQSILRNMTKIMKAISEQRDEFQQLLLSVLQKEVVPEIKALQGSKAVVDNNLLVVLNIVVDTLCQDLSWLQALTTRQRFCWGIVACCCSKIPISSDHFEWTHTFSYIISQLGHIFHAYCSSKDLPEDERVLSSKPLQDILHSPSEDIKRYFEWVQQIQDILLSWQKMFLNDEVNYDDIMVYASYQAQLEKLCGIVCVSVASLTAQNLEEVKTTFLQQFEQLNVCLLRYIPGQPEAHWCTLPSLLAEYGVALPPTLLDPISNCVLFPGEEKALAEKLLVNPLPFSTSANSQFQPGHKACCLRLSKKISLKGLSALVQELQDFLIPVIEHINVLVFFKLHHSEMFEKYLRLYFRKETAKSETLLSHGSGIPASFPAANWRTPALASLRQSFQGEAVEGLPLPLMERCLARTKELLLKLMDGTATYSEIIAEEELNLKKLDIEQEFNTLMDFAAFLNRSGGQQGLSGVRNMLELFQFTVHIQSIQSVCEQYHLQGCLEDKTLRKLLTLVEEIESEANRANLTPLDASEKLLWVKESLCLDKKTNYKCLDLFAAVADSAAFYQFVQEKMFVGENGQAVFGQQYQLITAQLQHEEYDETVLNHLFAAFKFISPFMNTKQSFRELMTQVSRLDATNGLKQLETVNTNITLIRLWFSQVEGDTLENVANQLNCILDKGFYIFDTTVSGLEIVLEYVSTTSRPSQPSILEVDDTTAQESVVSQGSRTYPQSSQSHSESAITEDPTLTTSIQRWNSEQISDFVRKLGFQDAEKEGGDRIKQFLRINEIAYKLLSLYQRLKELGHPQYLQAGDSQQNMLPCGIDQATAERKVIDTEQILTAWSKQVAELHSIYDWLLFFSVPKLLLLHQLLIEGEKAGPLAEEERARWQAEVVREVSFLCENTSDAREQLMKRVKKSLASCRTAIDAGEAPMDIVGQFLAVLFDNHSLPRRRGTGFGLLRPHSVSCSALSSESLQVLHYCPNYSQAELIQLIVSIYDGMPESFEVFRCQPFSTEEELSLFLKRVAKHPLQFLLLDVNRLPFKLQEYLMQAHLSMQQQVRRETGSDATSCAPCIHFIETAPSVLRKMPWIILREHKESGPGLSFEDARNVCLERAIHPNAFSRIELVYGNSGDGKTHYIQQQLQSCPASLTIAVNEAFSPLNTIRKLRGLPMDKRHCGIFFNFTLLPPGDSVADSEREQHQQLMEVIGWFFFDLLLLGYVEDPATGLSFRIPCSLEWGLYIEVPSCDHVSPDNTYKRFCHDLPTLGLLGTQQCVSPDTPYSVDAEVQLVCKYLQAFKKEGVKGIDELYRDNSDQPVKFSLEQDLPEKACQDLLLEFMPEHISKTKITQRLFIKYMYRRCSFLDSLPAFNFNSGIGEYMVTEQGWVTTNTRQLGSTLMSTMLKEVADFCDPAIRENWSHKPHQQLIYDFKDGGASLGLISLQPDQLLPEDKLRFERIGVKIPSLTELHSRNLLDGFLSRALNVELENGRLVPIDDSNYVLTLDYTIKMLDIHERYHCGVPVIIEGETGVGKTALMEMLSKLWNHALLVQWKREYSRLLDFMRRQLGDISVDSTENYQTCLNVVEKLSSGDQVTEEELVILGQLPDINTTSGKFYSVIRSHLLSMRNDPVISLLKIEGTGPSLEERFMEANSKDSAEDTAHLLHGILTAQITPTFHKVNIHAAMTPGDIQEQFKPVFSQANFLKEAYKRRDVSQRVASGSPRVPFVTVFLDEVNTSSCLGIFKEIIVDRTFDGEPIPENVFIVAACNPHRGNSLVSHQQTWVRGSYYVRRLHPTLRFLMWDYGSLDEQKETDYINAKMKMLNQRMPNPEVASLTGLIVSSQNLMRQYAFEQLKRKCRLDEQEARISSRSCVSQRDIQRVFTFYQWLMDVYQNHKPHSHRPNYDRRAVMVALAIVYYMRLDHNYRETYRDLMDKERRLPNEVSFSQAFEEELNWYMDQVELPAGIARTQALKENLFATIVCTVTHTPLILVGAPGSSKTLSFNLAIANLKGQESKVRLFRDTAIFRSLDPHFYQCSRRTTSNEIQIVFSRAVNRQRSHSRFSLPIYCVVFMDEAGLPEESHESLKVLHYHLDRQEVSFVAITNHILDAAKTNRAVSLFRPEASRHDLETLAKGCLCSNPDNPPPELRKDLKTIVQFCTPYCHLMKTDTSFSQVFGLRDFIHFVNYLRRRRTQMLTSQLVMDALERNFNGSDNFKTIAKAFLSMIRNCNVEELHSRSVLAILQDSLKDRPQQNISENEVRYKLIIDPSEDDSLTRLLFAFGVLPRNNTRMFVCSDFPGDSQLQKINTIAAIRHSAIQGHTVVMSQTDDIHESFYDLFNQRFRRIDDPKQGPRYYTNIAIGAHLKPCRVDPSFQCVVVVKKSELKATPAPFLNRFEKYCITHHTLRETAMARLPSFMRILMEAAREKAQQFVDCVGGSGSFYGLKEETLDSLVLTILPSQDHAFHPLEEPSTVDYSGDVRLFLMQELLGALRNCAGFNIPLLPKKELCLDMEQLFTLVTKDPKFEGLLTSLSHHQVLQAVVKAMEVLHVHEETKMGVSIEVCLVVAVLEQWLVRYFCKRLTQLMTCEALILHRRQIPSSYIVNYLAWQAHFSLRELLGRYYSVLEASSWNPRASPTKLLCFSRSSNLIHQLPALFPTSALNITASTDTRQTLKDLVFAEPEQMMVCKLSSLPSQSGVQDLLRDFVHSDSARVLLLVANMQEASKKMVNHLRIMIEEAEAQCPQQAKLFVLLLHFPPAQFFDPCYPSLFLHSWDHYYLDAIAHGAVRGVVDICDWFRQCCFPKDLTKKESSEKDLPEEDTLLQTLHGFLPEAIPILSSRVFFGSYPGGTFNCNMNGSQRSQALKQLLFDKGVGSLLCEKFRSYWKPATMTEYLEKAAVFTKNRESTLSITDFIQTFFKREFFDFLVYMVSLINDDFNLDVIFTEGCSPTVHQLFLDILRSLPIPRLSQLRELSGSSPVSWQMSHVPHFPFFKLVSEVVERVVESSRKEANQRANVLADAPDSFIHSPTHYNQPTTLQQLACAKIQERVESTPNDCLALALRAMAAHPELWQYYFEEFTLRQLHLESSSGPDSISHKILQAFLGDLHQQEPTARLVGLHIYMQVYQLDLGKMATLLRPLSKLQAMAQAVPQLLSPQDQGSPTHQFLSVVQQTKYPLGTPVQLSAFIINTLFNALVGSTYGQQSQNSISDKMTIWYKAYRAILMLPTLNQYIYLALEPDGGCRAIEAQLNVMHAAFLSIQTASQLDDDSLLKGKQVFQTLFSKHFSEDIEVKGECPRLDEVISVAVEVICETNVSPIVHRDSNRGRLLMEGLFAHFFSPHRPSYHANDCRWFLELANRQHHWQPGFVDQSIVASGLGDNVMKEQEQSSSGLLQLSQRALNMNVFKLYLARILGKCDQRTDSSVMSGPLLLYQHQRRAQVGQVLVSQEKLGLPAPFLPSFYQDCPPITPDASSENKLMQQPLAHLYFLTVMEHLHVHVEECRLSFLVKAVTSMQQLLLSEVTLPHERVLLHIEQQAVLQMVLERLSIHLQPKQRHTFGEINQVLPDINSLLDDPATGGGMVKGHSMVLGLHLLRKFKSWQRFSELLSQQYDSICRGINCLKTLHDQLKAPSKACAHLFPFMLPGDEGSELGVMYQKVATAMIAIHKGQGDVGMLVEVAKGVPTGGSIDRRMTFRMMIWLVTYYEFFDKKVWSPALGNMMGGEDMKKYLCEDSCVRLIQCFLIPEQMLKSPETLNILKDDQPTIGLSSGGRYRPCTQEEQLKDPLHQLFQPDDSQQQDQSDVDLCHSLANLVAVVLGSASRSNHLWYHLFQPHDLRDTYLTGFMYNSKISPDGLLYDCGVELTPEGQFGRQDYLRHACRGTFTLHSLYLLLWANFGAFCMALLTQPEAATHIHGPLISVRQSIRHYCVSQLRTVWLHMQNNLSILDEERSFLLMRCCMQFYDLLNTESEVSNCLHGLLHSREELDSYERVWHSHIYQPSWKELKPKFAHLWHTNQHQLFLDIRWLELHYPQFPMERDFTHSIQSSRDIQQLSEGGDLRLLSQFALEWPQLQAGGLLLPDLVEFYQWLHMQLAHIVTYQQATALTIGRVVQLVSQRSSQEKEEHLTALYNKIKTGYNAYVKMIGCAIGVGACAAVRQGNKIATIEDDTPLLHFLSMSDTAEEEEDTDWLYTIMAYIVTAHNSFLEGLYSLVHSQPGAPLARLLVDKPAKIFPTEVNDSHSIVGQLTSLHGVNELLQLIRSRHHPPTSTPAPPPPHMPGSMPTLQLSTSFQLAQLQEDIASHFIAGKPFIESPTHLRTPFRFRLPLDQMQNQPTSVVSSSDLTDVEEKLPDSFKSPPDEATLKRLEYEFHAVSYHTMVEVVTALRTLTGHLIKALLETLSSTALEQQTVVQFLLVLFDPLGGSSKVLREVGLHSPSPQQLACLAELPLTQLFRCLQKFILWVEEGVYDFCDLPFNVKSHMSCQDQQALQQIPLKWTGSHTELLERLQQISEVLLHSEARILKTVHDHAQKPVVRYLQEFHSVEEGDKLLGLIPDSILLQHYMDLRLALRRLVSQVQHQLVQEGAVEDLASPNLLWKELVADLWDKRLPNLREANLYGNGAFVFDPYTGRYGFDDGSDVDSKRELIDDLMQEEEKPPATLPEESCTDIPEESVAPAEVVKLGEEKVEQMHEQNPEFREKVQTVATSMRADTETLETLARDYGVDEVREFFTEVGLGQYTEAFQEAQISGEELLEADKEVLEELGVASAIDRLKMKELFRRKLQGAEEKLPVAQVLDFLQQNKLDKYGATFQQHSIDGELLLLLAEDSNLLKELGVKSPIHRLKIKTRFKTFASSPPLPDTETLEHLARDYGVDEVGEFFTEVGLGQYTEAFREAQISGEELLEADKEVLEELGVASAIDRLKIKELFRRKLQGAEEKLPMAQVLDFLEQNQLVTYSATFQQHSIDGELLLAADDNLLKELGVKSPVHRLKIKTRFKTFASSK